MNISKFSNLAYSKGVKYAFLKGEDDKKLKKYQIKKALKQLKKRKIKYEKSKGYNKLINLICKKENVNVENIIILQGSTLGAFYFFLMMNESERVMIFRPYYPLYKELAIMFKKGVSFVDLSINNFELTYEYFIANLKEDIKYVIINSPHNPTGKIVDFNELNRILKYCEENKIYVLLDAVYEELMYKQYPKIKYQNEKYIIHLKSFSKSYNMTGVRVGYVVASKSIIERFDYYIMNSLVSIPIIPQEIACSSLKKKKLYVLKKYKKNRLILKKFLEKNALNYISLDSTFYVFINIKEFKMSSYQFTMDLIEKKEVAILPGFLFGDDRFVRLSYMCKTKYLKKGLKRIQQYLAER